MVRRFDGEFPSKYFQEILEYLALKEDEFFAIVDRFRSPHLWKKENEEWKVEGNVILENLQNKESLNTEQLFWNPVTGRVHTEKFVRIERADEILTGTGLTATQDFSSYIIKKPEGTFNLEE